MVIETDASNKACKGILIQKHGDQEEIRGYASGAFKNAESIIRPFTRKSWQSKRL